MSLETILADPVAHHGRRVHVHGFLVLGPMADSALWVTEADYLAQRYERAAWLEIEHEPDHPLSGRRASLSGVVHSQPGPWGYGHSGVWHVGITNITGIAADPTDIDRGRPWLNDPLFVILASLGMLGLVFAMVVWRNRALRAFRSDEFAP